MAFHKIEYPDRLMTANPIGLSKTNLSGNLTQFRHSRIVGILVASALFASLEVCEAKGLLQSRSSKTNSPVLPALRVMADENQISVEAMKRIQDQIEKMQEENRKEYKKLKSTGLYSKADLIKIGAPKMGRLLYAREDLIKEEQIRCGVRNFLGFRATEIEKAHNRFDDLMKQVALPDSEQRLAALTDLRGSHREVLFVASQRAEALAALPRDDSNPQVRKAVLHTEHVILQAAGRFLYSCSWISKSEDPIYSRHTTNAAQAGERIIKLYESMLPEAPTLLDSEEFRWSGFEVCRKTGKEGLDVLLNTFPHLERWNKIHLIDGAANDPALLPLIHQTYQDRDLFYRGTRSTTTYKHSDGTQTTLVDPEWGHYGIEVFGSMKDKKLAERELVAATSHTNHAIREYAVQQLWRFEPSPEIIAAAFRGVRETSGEGAGRSSWTLLQSAPMKFLPDIAAEFSTPDTKIHGWSYHGELRSVLEALEKRTVRTLTNLQAQIIELPNGRLDGSYGPDRKSRCDNLNLSVKQIEKFAGNAEQRQAWRQSFTKCLEDKTEAVRTVATVYLSLYDTIDHAQNAVAVWSKN